jgi:hypothetical protein
MLKIVTVNRGVFTRWGEFTQMESEFLIIFYESKFY